MAVNIDGGVGNVPSSFSLKLKASKRILRERHCSFTALGKTYRIFSTR